MEKLKQQIASLCNVEINCQLYLSYQAVTNEVAAFLFPTLPTNQIDAASYQRILKTADSLCRELGYREVVKLTPPDVPFADIGLYWTIKPAAIPDPVIIHTGPGRVEMLEKHQLLDARLSQLGLDEVTRQHFKIPVSASEAVIDLLHRAVASDWPNDFKGVWHDILGMCVVGGKEISPTERLFTVIIRGLGQRRYWRFKAWLKQDSHGKPYLFISLAEEADVAKKQLFPFGHVVMTQGAAALGVDFAPYLAKHAKGDWGDQLDDSDRRQNDVAVKKGYRILSAYHVPLGHGGTERIWILTESDRSATTVLLPTEY